MAKLGHILSILGKNVHTIKDCINNKKATVFSSSFFIVIYSLVARILANYTNIDF